MLQSVRKSLAVPQSSLQPLAVVATAGSFGWLLAHDLVHPVVVVLLQLYLSF